MPPSCDPKRILILKPSSLGDVIQALPVLRLLRLQYPQAHLAWWVDASLAPLLEHDPDLNELIPFRRRSLHKFSAFSEFVRSIVQMRRTHYDWILDLQGLARSALVAWVANGGLTVGVEDRREGAPALHDVSIPRPSEGTHAVDWYLAVLRRLGVPVDRRFDWLPLRNPVRDRVLERWPLAGRRWISVQPGARWMNKRWPVEYFERVVSGLGKRDASLGFLILGGSEDRELGARLARSLPDRCLDLTFRTTLPEMVELLRFSKVMLTNDTGPMHAAAALRIPVVGLFGPTDPRRTGPYQQESTALRSSLPCSPCMKPRCRWPRTMECLHQISPETVIQRVQDCLE